MPHRVTIKPLAAALEAIIRYAEEGGTLRYGTTVSSGGSFRLTFEFDDLERYQAILREIARETEALG